MVEMEDWLQDPLRKVENNIYKTRKLRVIKNGQQDRWFSFHFATRLKLDGAVFFCRQALGAASMPDDLGLPLLAHRQTEWYLEAFFYELMSAYETLLQELNIVYAYDLGLKPDQVRWNDDKPNVFMKKLPNNIFQNMTEERKKGWFYNVQRYRNTATHHYTVPLGSGKAGFGEKPLDFTEYDVFIHYEDKTGKFVDEDICICKKYLKDMAKHISSIWQHMSQEFQ
jgi:GTP cyclohydrolase II